MSEDEINTQNFVNTFKKFCFPVIKFELSYILVTPQILATVTKITNL